MTECLWWPGRGKGCERAPCWLCDARLVFRGMLKLRFDRLIMCVCCRDLASPSDPASNPPTPVVFLTIAAMLRKSAQRAAQLLSRSGSTQLQQQRFLNVHEYQVRWVALLTQTQTLPCCSLPTGRASCKCVLASGQPRWSALGAVAPAVKPAVKPAAEAAAAGTPYSSAACPPALCRAHKS